MIEQDKELTQKKLISLLEKMILNSRDIERKKVLIKTQDNLRKSINNDKK